MAHAINKTGILRTSIPICHFITHAAQIQRGQWPRWRKILFFNYEQAQRTEYRDGPELEFGKDKWLEKGESR